MTRISRPMMACLSIVAIGLLTACGGGGGGGGVSRGPGDLTGVVTDVDGRVVAGATITVGSANTSSLSNGTFVFHNITSGLRTVVAVNRVNGNIWSGESVVDLVSSTTNRAVNIVVSDERTQGAIAGSVIGPNGLGIPGAKIFVGGPFNSTLAVADDGGNYFVPRVTPGVTYTVTASLAGFINDTRSVHVDNNSTTTASFALSIGSSTGALPAPTGLFAQTWTVADSISRSSPETKGLYDWLKQVYQKKRGLTGLHLATKSTVKPSGRSWPAGAVVETDLFWNYVSYNNLFGYAIKRATSQAALPGSEAVAILRDPLTSAFFDVDFALTPDVPYFYTVSALDTVQFTDPGQQTLGPPSAVVSANPFQKLVSTSPSNGTAISGNPNFQWNSLNGAAGYQIYVWDDFPDLWFDPSKTGEPNALAPIWPANLNSPGSSFVNAPATSQSYQGPALIPGHTYYWLIVGMDSTNPNNVQAMSASRLFKFVKQ
ncbi:MAG: carboxypeptidase-like regulatory domain-containing protein [Chthonomonadales bacterium]